MRSAGAAVAALLALSLVLPLGAQVSKRPVSAPPNPAFERYLAHEVAVTYHVNGAGSPGFGLIPVPLDLSHARGMRVAAQDRAPLSLPASFDLRSQSPGKLTPVRNQGGCGSCWSFATYGSMESCLLPGASYDFSENHLKNTHGLDWTCCAGGNHWISAAYLAGWSGPVAESADPYSQSSCASPAGLAALKHIQRIDYIPDRSGPLDNDNLKQAVMAYGALYTTYYHSDSYYNSTTRGYYYNGTSAANHAVCIVGWNDNHDRSRFLSTPPGNGAFIVRNSWGAGWGEGGYFYVSYYDVLFGRENAVFHNAEEITNYNQIYQYDPYGWVNSLGYGGNTAWFANVFTASADADLQAVSLYVASPRSTYELYLYLDSVSDPRTGSLAAAKTGTMAGMGYQTVALDSPVYVTSGQRFSVVLKLTTPGYNYPVPFEQPITGYSSAATARAGESHVSSDGSSWSDLTVDYPGSNVCLKAFATTATGITVEPASAFVSDGPAGGPFNPAGQVYTISNHGSEPIDWAAASSQPWLSLSSTGGTIGPGGSATVAASINAQAALLQPGSYGDTVTFTNTTNHKGDTTRDVALTAFANYAIKPALSDWIDPAPHTALYLSDDGVSPAQPMPFEFRFYDKPYTHIYIGGNGLLGFINLNLNAYTNTAIPNAGAPNAALYAYWDDLDPGAGGNVRIGTVGQAPNRNLVVSYVGVPRYQASATRLTFQAVLREGSNDIVFRYLDVKPGDATYGAGRGATVGVENNKGTAAAQYSHNGSLLLRNGQAILFTSRGATPLEAKLLPDGASVSTRRAVVTKVFGDSFYIESEDRMCGIRVTCLGHGLASEMRADVTGVMRTNPEGERFIEAQSVTQSGTGSVTPLGMGSVGIGGADLAYNSATGAGQKGVRAWRRVKVGSGSGAYWEWQPFDLPGPNTIGLLVETWGRVSWVGSGEFYVDDGCGHRDITGRAGVRVYAPGLTPPGVGSFVRLMGVVSCYDTGGVACRMLRVADQADIITL